MRYGGTGFSYKKHANYAAVLIADRTIIGKISLSIDQSVDIKMIFTGIQDITDHHIRSTGADNAVTLGIIQSRQNAGILIEQGDVQSGILFELIKQRIFTGDIYIALIQKVGNITFQPVITGIGSVQKCSGTFRGIIQFTFHFLIHNFCEPLGSEK